MKCQIFSLLLVVVLAAFANACEDTSECESKMSEIAKEKNDPDHMWICSLSELMEACPKTCKVCGDCSDSRTDCDYYKGQGMCEKSAVMAKICRKSCGKC